MAKLTQKQWEEYVIATAMLSGWEEHRWSKHAAGPKWRRAMAYLEEKKGTHICINGDTVIFRNPQE